MKKILLAIAGVLICAQGLMAQTAQKPTIMIVPAKDWCINRHYVDAQGSPDYEKALLDSDMLGAITEYSNMMAEQNYPLTDLQLALDDLKQEAAMDMALRSKGDGEIVEDDLDRLVRVASADILVELSLNITPYGPRRMVEFRILSKDAASGKAIHGENGASSASNQPIGLLLKEAMLSSFPNFLARIDQHFTTLEREGREGTLIFKIADDCPYNMESEVTIDGETGELNDYLDYWLSENTINGAHSQGSKSRVRTEFKQVRMPLFGKAKAGGFGSKSGKIKSLSAESFVKPIADQLRQLGVSVSVTPTGIGKAFVVLGARQ